MLQFEQIETSEKELAHRITQVPGETIQADKWIDAATVRKAIPSDGILVDVARFGVRDFGAKGNDQKWQPAHYAVWLVPPSGKGEIKIIDLGEADKIEAAVKAVRTALTSAVQEKHTAEEQKTPLDEHARESLLKQPIAELAKLVLQPVLDGNPCRNQAIDRQPGCELVAGAVGDIADARRPERGRCISDSLFGQRPRFGDEVSCEQATCCVANSAP